jgi:glutamyl-tRNA synthetase
MMLHGRYAPSPTGELHVGNLRTALAAWLVARASGGSFQLRIDDLDPERSRDAFVAQQLEDLRRIGLDWDGAVLRQSERIPTYELALDTLRQRGLVYPCFCTRAEIHAAVAAPHESDAEPRERGWYPGTCSTLEPDASWARVAAGEPACLRARTHAQRIRYRDAALGAVSGIVDDFVVRRRDGAIAYNLACAVDDAALPAPALVVRGRDLAATTLRQLWLMHALETAPPRYLHLGLVLGPDGERIAKRHGAVGMQALAESGISPEDLRLALAASLGLARAHDDAARATETLVARARTHRWSRHDVVIDPDAIVPTHVS